MVLILTTVCVKVDLNIVVPIFPVLITSYVLYTIKSVAETLRFSILNMCDIHESLQAKGLQFMYEYIFGHQMVTSALYFCNLKQFHLNHE